MTMSHETRQYNIDSFWRPREEAPEAVADRYIRMVEALTLIDPVFTPWWYLGRKKIPFDQVRAELPTLIAKDVWRQWGPAEGYRFVGSNWPKNTPRSLLLMGNAGNTMAPVGYGNNNVHLHTVSPDICPTDASIVTYDLFRSAMLAIIEAWDVDWCLSYPTDLMRSWPKKRPGRIRLAWMSYVAPEFAPLVRPSPDIETQTVAGGGILMAATRERFDVTNKSHLKAARAIVTAMAPFNALPWPPGTSFGTSRRRSG
jgi:hypothetical protein